MDIEDLNKTQIILLVLLVSFITSIATGIVTVTLMDQAPPGVTQTINRVVEKTVEVVQPKETKTREVVTETVVIKEENLIIDAVKKNAPNIVEVGFLSRGAFSLGSSEPSVSFEPAGNGFVFLSAYGAVATDASFVKPRKEYAVRTADGSVFGADIAYTDGEDGFAILLAKGGAILARSPDKDGADEGEPRKAEGMPDLAFSPVLFADEGSVQVGQTAIALRGAGDLELLLGVVSRLLERETTPADDAPRSELRRITTTIGLEPRYSGGPLLDTEARVIGLNVVPADGEPYAVPIHRIRQALEKHKLGAQEQTNNTPENDEPRHGAILEPRG